jgi:hypothetical protein
MALAILTISCFMFYMVSKYFPIQGIKLVTDNKKAVLVLASTLSLFSLYLFTISYDISTSIVLWMIATMTLLSAIVLSVKLNFKTVYLWGVVCILFVILDLA